MSNSSLLSSRELPSRTDEVEDYNTFYDSYSADSESFLSSTIKFFTEANSDDRTLSLRDRDMIETSLHLMSKKDKELVKSNLESSFREENDYRPNDKGAYSFGCIQIERMLKDNGLDKKITVSCFPSHNRNYKIRDYEEPNMPTYEYKKGKLKQIHHIPSSEEAIVIVDKMYQNLPRKFCKGGYKRIYMFEQNPNSYKITYAGISDQEKEKKGSSSFSFDGYIIVFFFIFIFLLCCLLVYSRKR